MNQQLKGQDILQCHMHIADKWDITREHVNMHQLGYNSIEYFFTGCILFNYLITYYLFDGCVLFQSNRASTSNVRQPGQPLNHAKSSSLNVGIGRRSAT